MRVIILGILLLILVYQVGWKLLRGKELSAVTIMMLLVVIVPVGFAEARWQILENQAGQVVRAVSGNRAGMLHCQRASEAFFDAQASRAGEVRSDKPNEAMMTVGSCQNLFDWMLSPDKSNPTLDQVIALHVLVHEAGHVGGDYNEASTECTAMQRDAQAAVTFGATPEQAEAMVERYYKEVYVRMSEAYQSPECVDDGEYDLNPESHTFP